MELDRDMLIAAFDDLAQNTITDHDKRVRAARKAVLRAIENADFLDADHDNALFAALLKLSAENLRLRKEVTRLRVAQRKSDYDDAGNFIGENFN